MPNVPLCPVCLSVRIGIISILGQVLSFHVKTLTFCQAQGQDQGQVHVRFSNVKLVSDDYVNVTLVSDDIIYVTLVSDEIVNVTLVSDNIINVTLVSDDVINVTLVSNDIIHL